MKVLFLDIETSPHTAYCWGLHKQFISLDQIIDTSRVLCYTAKWEGSKDVMFDSVHKSKPLAMLKRVHKLLAQADAVVTYYGNAFDLPTLNKEFIMHGLTPPAPYKTVDLCLVAKKEFKFASNKLDHIAQQLGLGNKVRHEGFRLWIDCMKNDAAAWARMEAYNIQDVRLTEKLYTKMLPFIKNHPNRGTHDGAGIPVCPKCGSGHLQRRGIARTAVNIFARYQCTDCGGWSREAISELPKEDRQMLLRNDLG